jgi:hypothetical protein
MAPIQTNMKRLAAVFLTALLGGCAGGGQPATDAVDGRGATLQAPYVMFGRSGGAGGVSEQVVVTTDPAVKGSFDVRRFQIEVYVVPAGRIQDLINKLRRAGAFGSYSSADPNIRDDLRYEVTANDGAQILSSVIYESTAWPGDKEKVRGCESEIRRDGMENEGAKQ